MPFVPGQLVKCVGHNNDGGDYAPSHISARAVYPRRGSVYTIATVNRWTQYTLVTLVECNNSHLSNGAYEPGFDARGFRPIDDKALDIFRQVLTDAPKDMETV